LTIAIAGLASVFLVLAAGRSDTAAEWPALDVGADLAVGASFLVAAAAMRAPGLTRVVTAGVGALWLLGSVVPAVSLTYRTALVWCLLVFAADPPAGWARRGVAVVSLALAVPVITQVGVAGVFGAVAVLRLLGRGRTSRDGWSELRSTWATAAVSAGAVVAIEVVAGLAVALRPQEVDADVVRISYESVLLAIAVALLASTRLRPPVWELSDVLLDRTDAGASGLTVLLRDLLRDPDVEIVSSDPATALESTTEKARLERIPVFDGGRRVADLLHRPGSVADSETLEAILVAVRLSVAHERVSAELERRRADLVAASARLEWAGERRRALLRERLRGEVLAPIEQARSALARVRDAPPLAGLAAPLSIAARELGGAEADILAVADGMPPLGPGSLSAALLRLGAGDSRVAVNADATASADEEIEAMLRFVASELLTNSLKHAGAGTIRVVLRRDGADLALTVADDGEGGADFTGWGLIGVADRVRGCGGRIEVRSPTAGGTTVTVTVPVRTPSSTA